MTPCSSLTKAGKRLTDPGTGHAGSDVAFLVLSGAFNPVHAEHLRMLSVAKAKCERTGWSVIGGFLAPSSDDYVRTKLAAEAWSLDRRIRLCELATSDSDWIDVWPRGELSGYHVATQILEGLRNEFAQAVAGRSVIGVDVMGSDTATRLLDKVIDKWRSDEARARRYHRRVICCIVRQGPSAADEVSTIRTVMAPAVAPLGVQVTMTDPEESPRPVSSARIRLLMSTGGWDIIRSEELLHPRVFDQLRSAAS